MFKTAWLLKRIPPHLYVAMSGWFSRIIVVIAQLISIPIFYQKLDLNDFAVFTIITSLVSWYSLTDFGIGSALQNYISEYRAQKKDPAILLTTTFPVVIIILIILAIALILIGSALKTWLFDDIPNSLSISSFTICMILYCWYFMLLISSKIFFAYQKGFFGYFYQSVAYLILLLIMAAIHYFNLNISLSSALYSWILPLFLSGLIGFVHAFAQANARVKLFYWDNVFLKQMRNRALQFWLFALSANGVLAIDYLVIVKLLSAKDIVTYNIANKIFVMMLFAYSAVLSALWPVLAEKYAKNTQKDLSRAERELRLTILAGIAFMVIMTLLVIFSRDLIAHLFNVQEEIEIPVMLLILFGVYGCIRVWSDSYATALQARSVMRIFLIQTPIQAVISISLMLWLAHYGLTGVVIAIILSFLIIPVWVLPYWHYRNLRVLHVST